MGAIIITLMKDIEFYNFHSHTTRCGHALDNDEDYIVNAINSGFKVYGMSDHVMFLDLDQKGTRGNYYQDYDSYLTSFKELKERYKNRIELHVGFEAEYTKKYHDYYCDLFKSGDIEYLLLGQHYLYDDELQFVNYEYLGIDGAREYVNDVKKGMASGLFLYVAHPDILVYFYPYRNSIFYEYCKEIILESIRLDVPLELNVSKYENLRLRGDENPEENCAFPNDIFWDMAGHFGAKVVIGLDAHKKENVNPDGFKWGLEYAKKKNLHVLEADEILKRMNEIREKIINS